MKKASQSVPVNRCFGDNCQDSERQKERKIKEILSAAAERRKANKEIDCLLRRFQGKKILDLLPVIKLRFPGYVLRVAIERVERRKDDLRMHDLVFFEGFKASLKEQQP